MGVLGQEISSPMPVKTLCEVLVSPFSSRFKGAPFTQIGYRFLAPVARFPDEDLPDRFSHSLSYVVWQVFHCIGKTK